MTTTNTYTIADLLDWQGMTYKVSGENAYIRCPDSLHVTHKGRSSTHDDSLSIHLPTGMFKCWTCGACGGKVDLLTALGYPLSALWGLDVEPTQADGVGERAPRHSPPIDASQADWVLSLPPPPANLLEPRGISPDVDVGIRWYQRKHAYVFPVGNPETGLAGYECKTLTGEYWAQGPKGAYLFGQDMINSTALVLESPLDVARFYTAAGHLPVEAVATYGANVTSAQLAWLSAYDYLILAFDNDDAGRDATAQVLRHQQRHPSLLDYTTFDYAGTGADKPKGDLGDMTDDEIVRTVTGALRELGVSTS